MLRIRRAAAIAAASCAALATAAAPADAASKQQGLVNVALEDILVQAPIGIAANLCDINVAVLAQLADAAEGCEATADSAASAGPSGNGSTRQEGLVNVLVDDVVVQVPIALAANICDVNVAILAEVADDAAACNADADSDATFDNNTPGSGGGGAGAAFTETPLATDGTLALLDNDLATDGGTIFGAL